MRILLLLMLFLPSCALAQDQDSIDVQDTTAESLLNPLFMPFSANSASADTIAVDARDFDSDRVKELKEDPDLRYGSRATVGESLWQRFMRWLGELIDAILRSATETNWGRLVTYTILLVVFVVIVMMILRVNAFKVFYGGSASAIAHKTLNENIHEMDFDHLIREALTQTDYRLAVRLQFLFALKMLSDKNYIHWEQGKTNTDYVNELSVDSLKNGFSELNHYFEYAWYGNFAVTHSVFAHVKQTFDNWRRSL